MRSCLVLSRAGIRHMAWVHARAESVDNVLSGRGVKGGKRLGLAGLAKSFERALALV